MDQSEVYLIVDMALRHVCSCVGAPECGVNTRSKLLEGIQRANADVHTLAMSFLEAYWNYFQFSNQIISQGKSGKLNADEFQKFETLKNRAEETTKHLAQKLQSLPSR